MNPTKRQTEAKQVFMKSTCEQTHMEGFMERVLPSWQFESLIEGIYSGFPLANHFALLGSESIYGSSQGLPCVHTHLLSKMDSSREAYE